MAYTFEQRFFSTSDGTRIGYQVAGTPGRPRLLLGNGLGGNYHAFQPLVDQIGDRYWFCCWDYRGLFSSAFERHFPRRRTPRSRLRVETHARDGIELLEREGFDRFPIVAWSMGVQVALEIYRRLPERITGLALLNGVAGNLYRTAFGRLPQTDRLMPVVLEGIRQIWPVTQTVVVAATQLPRFLDLAAGIGIVRPEIDRGVAGQVVRAFGGLDMHYYFDLLTVLGEHDASDVLPTVRCPTLVVSADHDLFTPGFASRDMAAAIAGAEVVNFPHGSHYTPIEYPDEVNAAVERFLGERVGLGG
ncbi:MAG: alpha/beta hydrolase [Deltaproteobacteria bacterium]|nr:alpha/beta hydrolase [Deltaproteobacteria bacterium]